MKCPVFSLYEILIDMDACKIEGKILKRNGIFADGD